MEKKTRAKKEKAPTPKISKEEIDFLFERFLTDPKVFQTEMGKPRDYARETQSAKSLLKKYEFQFWKYVNLGFRVRFLRWFNTDAGKKVLEDTYKQYLKVKEPEKPIDKPELLDYTRTTQTSIKGIRDRLFK
jgi:hypothetical protein